MQAVIKKIKLKKFINRYYFKIELKDLDGRTHVINKPLLSDPINFRKQVFGIMSACGSYDLMKLATDKPNAKKVIGYYKNRLQILENEKKEWLTYDNKNGKYICYQSYKEKYKILKKLIAQNIANVSIDEGRIQSIKSESGIFSLLFSGDFGSTFYMTAQIYYGMGYPLNIGNEKDTDVVKRAAQNFTSFIVCLMNFYGIDDLLQFGGNVDKFPVVEITLNNNEIDSITNPNTGIGLFITKKYDIVNINELEKSKSKKKIYRIMK